MNREKLIQEFLIKNAVESPDLNKIHSDASFRNYYRISKKNLIVMDASSEKNSSLESFVRIANLLLEIKLSAPKIYAADFEKSLLLLEDFGQTVFSKVLSEENEEQLYRTAIEIIDYLHRNYNPNPNKKNGIFDYSEIELVKEARLFVDWYLKEHKQISLKEKSIIEFEIIIANIFKDVAPCRESIVLRDYHVDNLFFLQNRNGLQSVGLIDFQDALAGSPVYDLASLIEDVRRPLNRDLKDRLLDYFINLSDLSENQIRNEMSFFSVQRNLKILGIFCRLKYRDKKDSYMRLIPNGISFIQNHLNNDNMDDLNKWFKRNNVDLGPSN